MVFLKIVHCVDLFIQCRSQEMFGMASGERFWQRRPFDGVLKLLESKFMVYNFPYNRRAKQLDRTELKFFVDTNGWPEDVIG